MNWAGLNNLKKLGKTACIQSLTTGLVWNTLEIVANKPDITVTEVMIKLRCEQSEASWALNILLKLGLVKARKQGKYRFYEISDYSFKFVKAINNLYVNNRDFIRRSAETANTTV